ncbi:MAG: HD-GYP domain-containing protein [Thermoleophilia bacterium]|nr:HD-GYP domain-containing protein [Thermoleophilia bacterium]MDH5280360.1 HD-GYP domain-containing protein [Thermoleophilia bacterium]
MAVALMTGCALIAAGYTLEAPLAVLALGLAAAVAERISVRFAVAQRGLTRTEEQSISLLPTLFAAVLFGPLAAAAVGAASMLGDPELTAHRDPDRAPRLKWATYTSTRFIGGAAMGLAAQATLAAVPSVFGELIAATFVGAIVGEALDVFFTALTGRIRGRPIRDAIRTVVPVVLTSAPIYAPIVALLAFMYVKVSPWTLALFLVPAMAAQRLYGLYQEQRQLADELSTANETLERTNLQFAAALIATLDARDQYTAGHSAAVAIYSRDIVERMGLGADVRDLAYLCGLVHDIGKIGLPPGLLEKPGALTLEERRQMQEHSAIGERILAHVDEYSEIATVVRHHHERIDGQGYPDGLIEESIPLVSRIIAVADAYNAMTSSRPYRDAMPSRVARLRLAQAVDSQFDTSVVAAFEAILAGATEDYRLAQRRDFREFAQSTYDESRTESVGSVAEVA